MNTTQHTTHDQLLGALCAALAADGFSFGLCRSAADGYATIHVSEMRISNCSKWRTAVVISTCDQGDDPISVMVTSTDRDQGATARFRRGDFGGVALAARIVILVRSWYDRNAHQPARGDLLD